MILPLFVAFDRLDPAMREASKDLGANRFKTFMQVSLPLAMPGIVAGLLLVFIPLMGDYITAEVLGGAKGNMLGQLVAVVVRIGTKLAAWVRPPPSSCMVLILLTVTFFGVLGLIAAVDPAGTRRVELVGQGAAMTTHGFGARRWPSNRWWPSKSAATGRTALLECLGRPHVPVLVRADLRHHRLLVQHWASADVVERIRIRGV